MEPVYGTTLDGTQEWRLKGQLHRLDGAAVIYANGSQEWRIQGRLHRLEGPAYIGANGTQEWWVNGHLHRLDGPASIRASGKQEWWVNYQNITTQVEAWMQTQAVTWPWDDQTQMQFILTFG